MIPVNAHPSNHLWEKTGLVLLSGFLYAAAIAGVDVAASHNIPPATLTVLRLTTAAAVFCGILYFLRPKYRWCLRGVADIVIVGLLNIGFPFFLLAMAVEHISSSLAAVLFNTMPVFTIVIAHYLLPDEKLSGAKVVGTITAIAGATILVISNESGLEIGNNQGWISQFLIVIASLAGALGVI